MKIALVNHTDVGGGAEKIAIQLLQHFQAMGHEAFLFVGVKQTNHPRVISFGLKSGYREKLHHHYTSKGVNSEFAPSLETAFNRLGFKPDLIHFHNLHGGYFNIKELPKVISNRKSIITLHDDWVFTGHCAFIMQCDEWKNQCNNCPDLNRYPRIDHDATATERRLKERLLATDEMGFVAVSEHQLELTGTKTTQVIPNGINLSIFKPSDKQEARKTLNLPEDKVIILLNGNYAATNSYRDTDILLRICRKYESQPGVLFVVCGKKIPETANLKSVGFIREESAMQAYYAASDLLMHPALAESQGLSVMEAMACGKPVLTYDLAAYRTIFQHEVHGLKAENDTAFIGLIDSLIQSKSLRETLGKQALHQSTHFSLDTMLTSYMALISSL